MSGVVLELENGYVLGLVSEPVTESVVEKPALESTWMLLLGLALRAGRESNNCSGFRQTLMCVLLLAKTDQRL